MKVDVNVETKPNPKSKIKVKVKAAQDFKVGQLFEDCDGDLYLRCYDGCIAIEEDWGLESYQISEMGNFEKFPYFKNCIRVKGKVKVIIN